MSNSAARLREARQRSQMTPDQVAKRAGVSVSVYYDLEAHPEDLLAAISIGELLQIAETIGIEPYWLVEGKANLANTSISLNDFADRLRNLQTIRSIEDIEKDVGYEVSSALTSPETVLDWNLDCLVSLCRVLKIDLGSILHVRG